MEVKDVDGATERATGAGVVSAIGFVNRLEEFSFGIPIGESATGGEGARVTGIGEGTEATGTGEGAGVTGIGEGIEATGTGEGAGVAGIGEGTEATGTGEGAGVTGIGEGTEATGTGEGAGVIGTGEGTGATGTGEGALVVGVTISLSAGGLGTFGEGALVVSVCDGVVVGADTEVGAKVGTKSTFEGSVRCSDDCTELPASASCTGSLLTEVFAVFRRAIDSSADEILAAS